MAKLLGGKKRYANGRNSSSYQGAREFPAHRSFMRKESVGSFERRQVCSQSRGYFKTIWRRLGFKER